MNNKQPNGFGRLTASWNRFSKTAAALVPILALLLTVFSAAATHKHDRLSVIPKLSFDWNTGSGTLIGLFVENSGAGPAVIKTFSIEHEELLRSAEIFSQPPIVRSFLRTYFFKNGEKVGLLTIDADKVKNVDDFRRLIEGQVLFTIEYCSIYGQCWKESSKLADPTCGVKSSPAEDIFHAGFWTNMF